MAATGTSHAAPLSARSPSSADAGLAAARALLAFTHAGRSNPGALSRANAPVRVVLAPHAVPSSLDALSSMTDLGFTLKRNLPNLGSRGK